MPKADPKVPEPIQLKELMERFASAVVNASYQLDEANVELRNLYVSSDNLDLAAMGPSRYVLDEVRIDLCFVVKEAKPDVLETHQLPEEHKKVNRQVIRPVDPSLLHAKLAEAANHDALIIAKDKLKPLVEGLNYVEMKLKQEPHFSTHWLAYQERKKDLQRQIKLLNDTITALSGKLPLTNEQIENVRRLDIPFTNWDEKWNAFYSKYESLRATYAAAVNAFQKHMAIPQIENFQRSDQDQQVLRQITEKGADWNGVRGWVSDIRNDYDATLAALNALLQLMAEIRGSGLKVRIDREAVAAAPVEARQKINFTFHGLTQETVKIRQAEKHKEVVF